MFGEFFKGKLDSGAGDVGREWEAGEEKGRVGSRMRVRPHGSYLSSQADEANLVHNLPKPTRTEATAGLDERKAFPVLNYRQ